jgi:hypothetical protein
MNSQQLSRQAQSLQAKAASARKEAERNIYNADTFEKNGDETRATIERETASRLTADADGFESEANQLHDTSLGMDAQAQQLDARKKQVEAEYKSKIDEIDKEKERLVGGF